jgi:hypothetical protein
MDSHQGARQFVCDFQDCGKSFLQRSALKRHADTHKTVPDFTCRSCPATLRNQVTVLRKIGVRVDVVFFCTGEFDCA